MVNKYHKKTNLGIDTIRQRNLDTKRAIDGVTKKKPKKKAPVMSKSQTNKSIRKGEQKLRGMSKAQIEKLRAKLRAKKKKK